MLKNISFILPVKLVKLISFLGHYDLWTEKHFLSCFDMGPRFCDLIVKISPFDRLVDKERYWSLLYCISCLKCYTWNNILYWINDIYVPGYRSKQNLYLITIPYRRVIFSNGRQKYSINQSYYNIKVFWKENCLIKHTTNCGASLREHDCTGYSKFLFLYVHLKSLFLHNINL